MQTYKKESYLGQSLVAALRVTPIVRDKKLLLKPSERTGVRFMLEGLQYGTFTYGIICTLMDQKGREHKIGQQFHVHVK